LPPVPEPADAGDDRGSLHGREFSLATAGSGSLLGIRPENMIIGAAASQAIEGTVVDVSFFGAQTHCIVEVDGFSTPFRCSVVGPLALAVGSTVSIGWNPADAVVLDD
jgi:ABC-type Fe3+/spermidine/putrescine transport system ATPase subunit